MDLELFSKASKTSSFQKIMKQLPLLVQGRDSIENSLLKNLAQLRDLISRGVIPSSSKYRKRSSFSPIMIELPKSWTADFLGRLFMIEVVLRGGMFSPPNSLNKELKLSSIESSSEILQVIAN